MKTVIEMAKECGFVTGPYGIGVPPSRISINDTTDAPWMLEALERFAELVRAEEREKYKWDVHSCGPTCKRYACVVMCEAVEAEREACAKVAEDSDHVVAGRGYYDQLGDADATARNITAAIRARSNT